MKILVVEDEEKIAKAIQRGLRQQGYACDIALDGDEGLLMAQAESYDLFILDIMLPGSYSGLNLIKEIRDTGSSSPILMLTAKDTVIDRAHGLNAGADDYLVKPFAFLELIARVRALLRRAKDSHAPLLNTGSIQIDPDKQSAVCNSQEIELSKKEFSLLNYLMLNKGRVITKDQLINHVWDSDQIISENTVEVHIASLRKKIRSISPKAYIDTKKGFGYIFKDDGVDNSA